MTGERAGRPRRVLMVLYLFPPLGGVGMSRNLRNTQYLPRSGWQPVVLTPRNPAYLIQDPATLGLVDPATEVVRTRSIEAGHLRSVLGGLAGLRPGRAPGGPTPTDAEPARPADAPVSGSARPSPARRTRGSGSLGGLLRRVRPYVFFPDEIIGWLPFAVVGAIRRHRAAPVDAIFSTSSPVTAHLIAGVVHRVTGLPWVAELRDPWVGNVLDSSQRGMLRTLRRRTERWIVRNASEVVVVTPTLARMYAARYPAARVTLVTNGYDRGETVAAGTRVPDGQFRIVFTGTLDRPAELETFLEGVQRLVAGRPDLASRLRITFYGLVSDECRRVLDRMATDGLGSIVSTRGFVTRSAAAQAVADADAALVLLGAGPGMELYIGGKLYDYLGQNQQVFAMVPPGDARDLLQGLDWGVVADPDPASVAAGLERLIDQPRPDRLADPEGRYDRATLAGRLAGILDRAVETRGEPGMMVDER